MEAESYRNQDSDRETVEFAPAVYDLREVAQLVGMPYSTAWGLRRAGKFPVESFRLGAKWLFRKVDVDRWLGIESQG